MCLGVGGLIWASRPTGTFVYLGPAHLSPTSLPLKVLGWERRGWHPPTPTHPLRSSSGGRMCCSRLDPVVHLFVNQTGCWTGKIHRGRRRPKRPQTSAFQLGGATWGPGVHAASVKAGLVSASGADAGDSASYLEPPGGFKAR